jgi:hypothetical protein
MAGTFRGEAISARRFGGVEPIRARSGRRRQARAPRLTGRFGLTPEQVDERFAVHHPAVEVRSAAGTQIWVTRTLLWLRPDCRQLHISFAP